jgi:hypothetical protein
MYYIFVLNILICSALIAANSDFLIVKDPAALYLLDVYEQRLSEEVKAALPSYTPFRILKDNLLLSDTYTRAIKTECGDKTYFLVKNNQDNLVNDFQSGKLTRITNARILADTIQIKQSNQVTLMSEQGHYTFAANELVQLIFQKNNRYYVKRLLPPVIYGWINSNRSRYWRKFTWANLNPAEKSEFPVYLVNSIQSQFEDYNRILRQLFTFFNQEQGEHRKIPSWILIVEGNRITCRLENKPEESIFEQTTLKIINRIEKILPQGQGKITWLANSIVIHYGKNKTI